MNTEQLDHAALAKAVSRSAVAHASNRAKPRAVLMLAIAIICLGVTGCATDGYVGVSAYPDYSPFYGSYGYSGVPYSGYGGIYARNIVVGGRRHHGGYGRHHFSNIRGGLRGGGRSHR